MMDHRNVGSNTARRTPVRRKKMSKAFVVLLSFVLLVSIAGGATLAYLIAPVRVVANSITPGVVGCVVNSDYTVSLTEGTNVPAYVRVTYVATWQNDSGNVYYSEQTGVTMAKKDGWQEHDGIYYYPTPLQPGVNATTSPFAESFAYTGDTSGIPDGYTLKVDVIAEAIQAVGITDENNTDSYMDAWGAPILGK